MNCCGLTGIPAPVQALSGNLLELQMDDNATLQLDPESIELLLSMQQLQTFCAKKSTGGWQGASMANLTYLTGRFRAASRTMQLVWC